MRRFSSVVVAAFAAVLFVVAAPRAARADEAASSSASASSSSSSPLVPGGLGVFAGSYVYAVALGAGIYRDDSKNVASTMFVPVVGPYLTLKSHRLDGSTTITGRLVHATKADSCSGDAAICGAELAFVPLALIEYGLLVLDPIAQATGLVMAIAGGAGAGAKTSARLSSETPKVSLAPTWRGGPGLSLSVTRW